MNKENTQYGMVQVINILSAKVEGKKDSSGQDYCVNLIQETKK
jgi:hypothetical protein